VKWAARSLERRHEETVANKRSRLGVLRTAWLDATEKYEARYKRWLEQRSEQLDELERVNSKLTEMVATQAKMLAIKGKIIESLERENGRLEGGERRLERDLAWAEQWLRGEEPAQLPSSREDEDDGWDEARAHAEMIAG
jgi:hypothetical protein